MSVKFKCWKDTTANETKALNTVSKLIEVSMDFDDYPYGETPQNNLESEDLQIIGDYTQLDYKPINQYLRGYYRSPDYKKKVDNFEKTYEKLEPIAEDVTTYSGAKIPERDLEKMVEGAEWSDAGYSSTSRSKEIAETFSTNVLFIYSLKGGNQDAKDISNYSLHNESEILVNKGSKFKITKTEKGPDGALLVYLES